MKEDKNNENINRTAKANILIVDDDVDVLTALKDVVELELESCQVYSASNIEQAKLLAQDIKLDVALLDIKLGQDNGLDLLSDLKSIHPDVSCVMLTAFRDNKYTVDAVRLGASDYLYKPINPDELIRTITKLIQHQQIKKDILAANERFHTVFEQATQCLFLVDDMECIIDVNQTAMSFIGGSKSSIIGTVFCDTPWFSSSVDIQKTIKKGLSKVYAGIPFYCEINLYDKDKNSLYFDVYMKPVFDAENKVFQVVVECRNITERKKADDKIKRLNAMLELRVQERTVELEQSMLLLEAENKQRKHAQELFKKAKEQAEKASSAKSDFLFRMSHELFTPMNGILGFGQVLEADLDSLTESQQTSVKQILTSGQHLLSIIKDVLNLTQLDSGHLKISMDAVQLDDVMMNCLTLMKNKIDKNNLTLIDNISGKGYVVEADSERVIQSLLIILTNAVKYNSINGSIILGCEVVNGKKLRINIADTGSGIKQEDIPLLFIPFERLNPRFNVEGLGIGLVIAKSLVELMDGEIGVQSKLSEGSTFWIELNMI